MAVAIQPPMFQILGAETGNSKAVEEVDTSYWWNTSGHDLAKMLQEANYPEEVQRNFLAFYRDHIVPLLGNKPDKSSAKSGIGRDGNPFEYSFELKSSSNSQGVRFVVDLTELRPVDKTNPLSIATSQKLVDVLARKTPGFDDTWYRALEKRFVYSYLSPSEQHALIAKAGQQSSVVLGFDIHARKVEAEELPVMGKVYFLPCLVAAAEGITSWQAARSAVQQLPDVDSHPNILKSLEMINDHLSDKPEAWQMGTRFLATDLVVPGKARLKVYMRCFGTTFEDIWDFYTLGGRIPNLDEDREKFRDLMNMVSGTTYAESRSQSQMEMERFTSTSQKLTAIYFSLSAKNPYPGPKLCVYPANFAPNDGVIARGLDSWFDKYGWHQGGKSMEEQVKTVFTHRKLEEKTGIFTFIGIGRKEDPTKKDLSIQIYVSPELYANPRY